MITDEQRIELMGLLGDYILRFDERLEAYMQRSYHENRWFTLENQRVALEGIATKYLDKTAMQHWLEDYPRAKISNSVGIVAAGNIPAVAFHDVLAVFLTGHIAKVKLSDRDKHLLPYFVKYLTELEPGVAGEIEFTDKLVDFDAVIATGSNNSARYFNQYFGKYPNIIRKNRNAVGFLDGSESPDQLEGLADDVFMHFGLGCRNVSFLMVPDNFDPESLRPAFQKYKEISNHSKYRNNFDYNLALAMLDRVPYFDLENVILMESDRIISPIGCLYFKRYSEKDEAIEELQSRSEEIQCVVSRKDIEGLRTVRFGQAQYPALNDYADGVDTMAFLTSL